MAWCRRCNSRLPDGSRYCLTCQRMLEENEVSRIGLFRTAQRQARKAREDQEKKQQEQRQPAPFRWVLAIALPILLVVFAELLEAESGTLLGALFLLIIYLALSYAPSMLDRSEEVLPDPHGLPEEASSRETGEEAGGGSREGTGGESGGGHRMCPERGPTRPGGERSSDSYTH